MKHTVLSACLLLAVAPAAQQFRPERFAPVPARVAGWPTLDIEVGDVNRDGIDDVLIALDYGGVACLHADGNGGFIDRTTAVLTPAYASAWGVSLGDIDRDGDLDLAVAHDHEDRPQICLNQGDGTFVDVSAAAPSLGDVLQVVQWIDLDGDGALDLYVGRSSHARVLRQQNGRLVDVTAAWLPPFTADWSTKPQAIDVDRDGDVDLVHRALLLNDGTGRLTVAAATAFPDPAHSIRRADDFDGDGLVDLLVVTGASSLRLWLQGPPKTFVDRTATHLPPVAAVRRYVSADVDLDGDRDLCAQNQLLINDGTGKFADASATRWTALSTVHEPLALGDIDGDSDADLVVTFTQLVCVNHHRQTRAGAAPVIGFNYNLEFEVRPGYATGLAIALPWFASRSLSLRVPPFGLLGVDPATVVTLPPVVLAPPAGAANLVLAVPNVPRLAGTTFYVQSLTADAGGTLRLTNTLRDTIR